MTYPTEDSVQLMLIAHRKCERCEGQGLRQQGALRTICECVEIIPCDLATKKPYSPPAVEATERRCTEMIGDFQCMRAEGHEGGHFAGDFSK